MHQLLNMYSILEWFYCKITSILEYVTLILQNHLPQTNWYSKIEDLQYTFFFSFLCCYCTKILHRYRASKWLCCDMLATSKMTGLDLGGSASMASIASKNSDTDSKRSSTSSEEMLTTPKLLPDSGSHFSSSNLRPTSLTASTTSEQGTNAPNEDMLTTPVVTTPKTSDIWVATPPHLKLTFGVTSPDPKWVFKSEFF